MRTEHTEQVIVVNRVRQVYPGVIVFAIPNGGRRELREAARLKAEGVLAGVPDLFIARALSGYHGLFVEMKRAKGGSVSSHQAKLIERLRDEGYRVEVCRGADAAWSKIVDYLGEA